MKGLEIKDLWVSADGKQIVKGVSLVIRQGEIHALMGPNGSGKSSLAFAIMGHPRYKIVKGKILLDGEDITDLTPDERAKRGLFLGFQFPLEIQGVNILQFLRIAYTKLNEDKKISLVEFSKMLDDKIKQFGMDSQVVTRYLNERFSGGEKKRLEVLQMSILKPKIAILDEPDSGSDIDAIRVISKNINKAREYAGILLITHYNRILKFVKPDMVHILVDGRIVKSGDASLANEVEEVGYSNLIRK